MTDETHPHTLAERIPTSHASKFRHVVRSAARRPIDAEPTVSPPRGGLTRRLALGHVLGGTVALVGTGRPAIALAQATASLGAAPNQFALSGAETQITYDASTAGPPQLRYTG